MKCLQIAISEVNYAVLCEITLIRTRQRRDFETLCPDPARIYAYEHININR